MAFVALLFLLMRVISVSLFIMRIALVLCKKL